MILNCMLATNFGGTEKAYLDQLAMLRAAGLDAVAVTRRDCSIPARAAEAGLPCESFSILSDWDPITVGRARRIVARRDPSLILTNGRKAHRLFARAVGHAKPIVSVVHKIAFDPDFAYAGFICVAEHRRRMLLEHGVPAEKIIVIPNGIRVPDKAKTQYAIAPGTPAHIVTLGRLDPVKGFDVLIDALAILKERGVEFRCTLAGDGPLRPALEQQVVRRRLAGLVGFTGWVEDIAPVLRGADLFAFPSLREGFPLALLEALAHGLPVVSSRIDGPKEFLVEGDSGLLVPPRDPVALADALGRLIGSEGLRRKLARNGRRLVEASNSFESIAGRLHRALNNVIEGRLIGAGL
ncbi:MAG TPA: glycosyltransferase [Rhizomicrobium sp.]|jgi:glycosyltransferase involved in cell wall biosynthesis